MRFFSQWLVRSSAALVVLAALFFHIWQLAELPRGLYVDESSIGLNAALIAQTGQDEHGVSWPTYFEAFGEYKNPVYVYAAAMIFRIIGISEFSLRLTSAIFFYLFLASWLVLVRLLFRKNPMLSLYALLSASFLPWFFNLSRIAFEVISQLSIVTAALAAIKLTYDPVHTKQKTWPWAVSAGLLIALSFYTYSTARLLSGLLLVSLVLVYHQRKYWWRHLQLILSCGVGLIPLVLFSFTNPAALTARLREVSYWYDTSLSLAEKLQLLTHNYLQFFSPNYLLYRGDSILRHHSGPGGELYIVVGLLAVLGLVWLLQSGLTEKFHQLIVLLLLSSPVAAALTTGDSSLRSILVGLYLLLLSCFGLWVIQKIAETRTRRMIVLAVFVVLSLEVVTYLTHYFTVYPDKSIWAFQSYNTRGSLRTALQESSTDVVFSSHGNQQYAHAEFYLLTLGLLPSSITVGEPYASEGRCVVVSAFDETVYDEELYSMEVFATPGEFNKVKCFLEPDTSRF